MEREESLQRFAQYLHRRFPDRRTAIDYLSDVRQFAHSCPKAWREVTMQDIDAFVDQQRQQGLASATIHRRVAALKTFFDFVAEETGDLAWPNPVRFKRHAGKLPRSLPRDLSNEQVERLWAVIAEPRDRAWFSLMLRAGLRVGEVVSLTLTDIVARPEADRPARLRVCGKGRKERMVLLTADAYAVLTAWLAVRPTSSSAAVFLNARGEPLTANGVEWLLHQYGEQAGVTVTPHQLRHTFARQATEAGMPVTSLGKLLGHTDISTTQRYTAGADPELCAAYQRAMQQLTAPVLSIPPASVEPPVGPVPSPAPPVAPPCAPTVTPSPLTWPDWEAWAADLPPAIRQACLAFVRRHWPTWKPSRQGVNARQMLWEFGHFFSWQSARRPLTHPGELTLADLHAYQTARGQAGKATATINRTLDYVLALLRDWADQGQPVEASVFRLRALPQPERLPRHLSEDEAQHLEAHHRARLDDPDPLARLETACFFILAHTGLRASECVDLQTQDLDLITDRLVVRQGKGQRDRIVYLSDTARQAVMWYLAGTARPANAPLWLRPNGQPVSYQWLYGHVCALGEAAGVPEVTPHRLRHTLATRLLNAGMDVTRIQKLLGHEHLNTTMIYARVLDSTLEADYRRAMTQIERQQMPLSDIPQPAANWPRRQLAERPSVPTDSPLDNSV